MSNTVVLDYGDDALEVVSATESEQLLVETSGSVVSTRFESGDTEVLVATEQHHVLLETQEVAVVAVGQPGPPGPPGSGVSLVTPPPSLISGGRLPLVKPPLGALLHNMAIVFLDMTTSDLLPDGSLVDRAYVVEEHFNVFVDGSQAVFKDAGASLDGLYAQVSYLTWGT